MAVTKALVASLVSRVVSVPALDKDKNPKLDPVTKTPLFKDETVGITEAEVLDFSLRGNVLTVVTTSGEKLTHALSPAELKQAEAE
jgi:hypothetical protein